MDLENKAEGIKDECLVSRMNHWVKGDDNCQNEENEGAIKQEVNTKYAKFEMPKKNQSASNQKQICVQVRSSERI